MFERVTEVDNYLTGNIKGISCVSYEVTIVAMIAKDMSDQLQEIAVQKGISADVLIHLWMREKLQELKQTLE